MAALRFLFRMFRAVPFQSVPVAFLACALVVFGRAQDAATANPPAASVGPAQSATTSPTVTASANPIVAQPGTAEANKPLTPGQPHRARAISPEVAAQLAAAAPKYTPPPPKPAAPPEDDTTDLRDIDKPRNQIIRLPRVVVHAPPPPVFSERVVNTQKGLADIAMKRYLTETDRALSPFTLPLFGTSPEARAMSMYEEDERLKNMAELKDDAGMVSATDKQAGAYVKREVDRTFIRPGDFDWRPMSR